MRVQFTALTKRYGQFCAVEDLNLTIDDGALHFLLGPSGCGKTTTLRMLAGLEKPTSGKILFDDKDVTRVSAAERGVGMVFQNYALWPHMTVRDNILYGLKVQGYDKDRREERLQYALTMTQLARFDQRYPGQLSGGQQQRVALARALAIEPKIILLDEPLSNLDAKLRLEMRDNIARIHSETKITTVYVTHDQKEALSMGTDVSVMHGGKLIQSDHPRDLYRQPKSGFIAGFIGETNLLKASIEGIEADGTVRVASDLGSLVSRNARSLTTQPQVGQKVLVSIRPEAIHLSHKSQSDGHPSLAMDSDQRQEEARKPNHIQGTLKRSTYLGDCEHLEIAHATGTLKANLYPALARPLSAGATIDMEVDADQVLLLPADQQVGPET